MNIAKALEIKGWMTKAELELLAQLASESEIIVEFGCYHGRSTRALGDNTKGIVYAVDTWGKEYWDYDGNPINLMHDNSVETFKENLWDLVKAGKVIPCVGKSIFFNLDRLADFIFIDADHRYESVRDDIVRAKQLIKPGGIIAGHDYTDGYSPGVKKAVDEAFPICELSNSIWCVRL